MNLDLTGRRVALIGGAGFIGHHLALALARDGAEVQIIDGLQVNNLLHFNSVAAAGSNSDLYVRIISQRLEKLRAAEVPLHIHDVRDHQLLARALGQIKPDVIVHLAAVSHAGRSNKDPYTTFDHSLRTLANALECARGHVEHFVYFSSSMVYGNFLTQEVDEDHPLNPIGIYGHLKAAGENMVRSYQQVFGLPYTILRPSALYGPGCVSRRVGQIFIESALSGLPLLVDDENDKLDFTYIDDLVEGICLAIQKPESRNQIFNMTYGSSRSIRDLVGLVVQDFPDVKVERVERDRLMPHRGTLSVRKAQSLLEYAPQHPLEKGFPRYVQWYRELFLSGLATREADRPCIQKGQAS